MKQLFILFIILTFTSCYNVERNCSAFKTGTFYSEITINDSVYKSTFTRTNALQIETYNNHIDSSQVRWINNCEVIFRTINPKNRAERKDIHLKILTTSDSSYVFEYSYVGETNKQQGVAFKASN